MNEYGIYKLFSTPIRRYVYDTNKNRIVAISKELYDYLDKGGDKSDTICDELKKLQSIELLSNKLPQKIEHNVSQEIDYYLNNKVESITLQLTQKCNFRCAYCIYSEESSPYQRSHSDMEMTEELVEASIDFLFQHSRDSETVNIGLYGGEPFLKFNLIKHAVNYVEKNYYGKKVTFSITTNGSLLTDDIIDFLIEHEIHPMISLDGTKEIHDKYRHFEKNGNGTYEIVSKNMSRIKDKNFDFFRKLKLSTVVDPQHDLKEINDFLNYYYDNYNISALISLLSDSYDTTKTYIPNTYKETQNDERVKTFLYLLGYVDDGGVSPITANLIESIVSLSESLKKEHSFSLQTSPGGPCIPGALRLFVSADGTFYPCEHVSERSEIMKIGSINSGFNIEKIMKILNVANITEEQCKQCWAYHQCYQCAKFCDNDTELSAPKRLMECISVKNSVESFIRYYLMLKEVMEIKNDNQKDKQCCRLPI